MAASDTSAMGRGSHSGGRVARAGIHSYDSAGVAGLSDGTFSIRGPTAHQPSSIDLKDPAPLGIGRHGGPPTAGHRKALLIAAMARSWRCTTASLRIFWNCGQS